MYCSSEVFEEEKSFNGFKDDFIDYLSNQSEFLTNDFIDYIDPDFIFPFLPEKNTSTKDYSNIIYIVNPVGIDFSSNINLAGQRRGRKTDNPIIQHSLTKNDCKMAKIQIGYFTFLIIFINTVMKKLKLKCYFLQLEGKFKRNINQNFRKCLNRKTIKEILYNEPISEKYTKYDKFENKKIIDRLEKENQKIVLDILDKNFLYFFENLFYLNIKNFNLSTFGLDPLEIVLSPDVKMFNDLFKNSKCKDFNEYKNKMEKCAIKYFILSSLCNSIDEIEI
jgi:hypothetical protein